MPDTVSKTDNFLKAIEKYAEEQRSRMRTEAEDFKKREMNTAEEEGLKEAYDLIQKEMADIHNKISAEQSAAESEGKKQIFRRRKEIEEDVFAAAEKKLLEFTDTKDYLSFLVKGVISIGSVLTEDDTVICLREKDLPYQQELKNALSRDCSFETTDAIRIGGVTGRSRRLGRIVDETLDTRLEEQREWFYAHSGLTVTEGTTE